MANTYLQRTQATGDRRKHTLSVWVKKSTNATTLNIFTAYNASTDFTELKFNNSDQLQFQNKVGNNWSGELKTTRVFRDTNAWYHIVIVWDSANSTGGDRMKMYINGVEETSFISDQNPTQSLESNIGESGVPIRFGAFNSNEYFNGSMSHVHFSDGYVYDASTFGETDATTGEWKIKTSPSFTLGTTGYSILKDGNTITDQSTNSNDFSLSSGTLTKTEDNPSNVFATLNPLWRSRWVNDSTFEHGNTTLDNTSSGGGYGFSTLGMTSGKYYFEAKCTEVARIAVGVGDANFVQGLDNTWYNFNPSNAIGIIYDGGLYYNNTSNSAYHGSAIQTNDIVQIALDMDNYRMWFGINGTWLNSATQTQIENGTATYDVTTKIGTQNVINNGEPMHFFVADISGSGVGSASVNFGNGYFGTTAVSSAGTNASGIGIFEYDVPTGYTALSTKGLNL